MIKGVSKRVIVVKSPDPRIFEQAIFIVKEDYLRKAGGDSERVLREAKSAASAYCRCGTGVKKRSFFRMPPAAYAAAGAVAAGAAWLVSRVVI